MTVVATGTMAADPGASSSVARAGGVTYDLLLLSCVVEGLGQVVGVIAITAGERRVRSAKQAQLLSVIASHLIAANDNTSEAAEPRPSSPANNRMAE